MLEHTKQTVKWFEGLVELERQFMNNERRDDRQDQQITILNQKYHSLIDPGLMTVVGYCQANSMEFPRKYGEELGRKVSKYCKAHNLKTGKTPNSQWGQIGTYPFEALDAIIPSECRRYLASLSQSHAQD